eukprot:3368665-Amphidinium_carterae.1
MCIRDRLRPNSGGQSRQLVHSIYLVAGDSVLGGCAWRVQGLRAWITSPQSARQRRRIRLRCDFCGPHVESVRSVPPWLSLVRKRSGCDEFQAAQTPDSVGQSKK